MTAIVTVVLAAALLHLATGQLVCTPDQQGTSPNDAQQVSWCAFANPYLTVMPVISPGDITSGWRLPKNYTCSGTDWCVFASLVLQLLRRCAGLG